MNIRFTSTLTSEDENLVVPAVLKAFTKVLDLLPIAYAIRVDTSDAQVYVHTKSNSSPMIRNGDTALNPVTEPPDAGV